MHAPDVEIAEGRVLLVEDDAEIADVLRRSLRNEGYEAVSYTHLTLPTNREV